AVRVAVYGVHEFVSAEAGDLDLTAISGTLARRSQEIGDNAQAFRQAIERTELKVVGLPIVSLVDHSIQQIEFMVRQTPGSAPYPHFIFADKVGTAHQLDLVMLEYALGYLAASDDRKNTIIATNMAAETLIRNDAFRNITALLAREGSKPKRLVIELSFRSDILNLDRLANGIAALRKSGVGVALDAFGASPAPLNHLRALDLDYIKMAGQWVRGSAKSRRDAALVDAIATLGKDLDIGTVALDVDTLALATSLGGRGISHGQGRAFGHPIPIDTAKLAMLKAAG
ncbi:MAG: EAL domain-containing protein, partial [Hyphomicrobiales bacterium]|nr:EAL domain-containing protein [Hyphomicrobiales bacterium]